MTTLKRTVTLTICGIDYEISYPNTGQSIDIELLKQQISNGNYDALRFSQSSLAQEQADKIDMIATFNILIPMLKTDLNTKTLFDLTEEQSDVLLQVYKEDFLNWIVPIKKAIKNPQSLINKESVNKNDQKSCNSLE